MCFDLSRTLVTVFLPYRMDEMNMIAKEKEASTNPLWPKLAFRRLCPSVFSLYFFSYCPFKESWLAQKLPFLLAYLISFNIHRQCRFSINLVSFSWRFGVLTQKFLWYFLWRDWCFYRGAFSGIPSYQRFQSKLFFPLCWGRVMTFCSDVFGGSFYNRTIAWEELADMPLL